MRASRSTLNASVPDFHNNLGLLLRDTGRAGTKPSTSSGAPLHADPRWFEAYSNLGLALEAWDAGSEAIARLSRGDRAPARVRRGAPEPRARAPHAPRAIRSRLGALPLAPPRAGRVANRPTRWARPAAARRLDGRRFVLHGEQGLGDVLFFLRFAPELVAARRAARVPRRRRGCTRCWRAPDCFELGWRAGARRPRASRRSSWGTCRGCSASTMREGLSGPLRLAPDAAARHANARGALEAHGPRP